MLIYFVGGGIECHKVGEFTNPEGRDIQRVEVSQEEIDQYTREYNKQAEWGGVMHMHYGEKDHFPKYRSKYLLSVSDKEEIALMDAAFEEAIWEAEEVDKFNQSVMDEPHPHPDDY